MLSTLSPERRDVIAQLIRFIISGATVTALGVGVYAIVALVLRWHPQIGNILASKLESYEDALEAYRLALEEAPGDGQLVQAVREIGGRHEDLRGTVAEILVPVLERNGRHAELVDVLELRLTIETEPSDRVQTLRTIARVLENNLSKQSDAESALLRASISSFSRS